MSYDIHITRSPYWADRSVQITHEEWMRLAEADPEFEVCGRSGDIMDIFTLKNSSAAPTFYYSRGTVNVRGADESVLRKMIEVAAKLGAVVQGDEGEYYRLTDHGVETTWERPDPGSSTGPSPAG